MRKWILFITCLLLVGCKTVIDEDLLEKSGQVTSNQPLTTSEFTLTSEEMIELATSLVDDTLAVFDDVYYIDRSYPSDEQLLEDLQQATPYATATFIEKHLFIPGYSCTDGHCHSIDNMLMDLKRGFRTQAHAITNEHFQLTALYPSFKLREYEDAYDLTNDLIQSEQQTLDFILEEGVWKLAQLQYSDEDINIKEDEIEAFVTKHGYNFGEVISSEERFFISDAETIYIFSEKNDDTTYEMIARTGFISSSAGLVFYRDDSFYSEDEEIIERDNLTPYLDYFEDMSIYADSIDLSTTEAQKLVSKLQQVDATWFDPPYYNDEREALLALHKEYYDRVYKTYEYLVTKYPTKQDAINQYFEQWNEQRANYFHQYTIYYPFVTSENVVYIGDSMWIHRNFVFDLLVNEHNF